MNLLREEILKQELKQNQKTCELLPSCTIKDHLARESESRSQQLESCQEIRNVLYGGESL